MKHFLSIIAFIASTHINAASTANDNCIPDDWDGHWNTIKQCYFDKTGTQMETLGYFLREQDLNTLRESVKQVCFKKAGEFGGEMAMELYWQCFTASLQSEIDEGMEKASRNVLAFKSIDWTAVNRCKVTYFNAAVETRVGSRLKGNIGWTPSDFPKEVMNATCEIVADDDGLVIYEGSRDWESGNHFFYISVFDDYLISIHSQPEVTSTHTQWTVTEHAYITNESNTYGCFKSAEIEICYSAD
jgi:hypothetical protein